MGSPERPFLDAKVVDPKLLTPSHWRLWTKLQRPLQPSRPSRPDVAVLQLLRLKLPGFSTVSAISQQRFGAWIDVD